MRRLSLFLVGLAILAGINATVWRFEHAMGSGEVVLLELAPVDPRSLMQGDYMRLDYALARQLTGRQEAATRTLVVRPLRGVSPAGRWRHPAGGPARRGVQAPRRHPSRLVR